MREEEGKNLQKLGRGRERNPKVSSLKESLSLLPCSLCRAAGLLHECEEPRAAGCSGQRLGARQGSHAATLGKSKKDFSGVPEVMSVMTDVFFCA